MWAEGESVFRLDRFKMDGGDSSEGLQLFLVFSRCVSVQAVCVSVCLKIVPLLLAMLRCRMCSTLTAMSDMFWAMA